ncbi:hypothetical protein RhiirA5_438564 [Rhizophagus irregularis]|uniref:Uncharacterized protein n=1 Tax=Rhizophagus irregularis TaxID=588596 RepID=A0A2I1FLI2_9GLOM|nr:hypothetical protein RhiirA5_438564 [Rhizophagus irregularis]PKC54896.1 hypothetical protein RhiirA1_476486 [Rhizophagus irregularis]PKY35225.1 hypothetical protein RhiirB3_455737 [Rhizophagus irregularis]
MAGITIRYVTENELNNEMSIEELRYSFNEEQVFTLIPKLLASWKKKGAVFNTLDTPDVLQEVEPVEKGTVNVCQILQKKTIRDLAQHIIWDNLGEVEVKVIAKALAEFVSNANAATLISDITCSANKIQKEKGLLCENENINYPNYFALESVKERLDVYDVSKVSGLRALADIIIMLCICSAEIKILQISSGGVTGYAKN